MQTAIALLAVVILGACAPRAASPPGVLQRSLEGEEIELRALLLLLEDQRLYEPYVVDRAREAGDGVRLQLARALGRVGDPRGRLQLQTLLLDPAPEVRRAAAFSLGLLRLEESTPALLRACRDPDLETGREAAVALARIGVELRELEEVMADMDRGQALERLAPALFRFPPAVATAAALESVEREDPEVRSWGAFALCRAPRRRLLGVYRRLLISPDPWVRGCAARALGEVGDSAELAPLLPLLEDQGSKPTIEALAAARKLVESGRASASPLWTPELLRLVGDPRPGVRRTAIAASGAWLLEESLSRSLSAIALAGDEHDAGAALEALARGGDLRGRDLVLQLAASPRAGRRASAAPAAAIWGMEGLLRELAHDESVPVRLAANRALLEAGGEAATDRARLALEDGDGAVRALALGWLAQKPVAPVEEIVAALSKMGDGVGVELKLRGVEALAARGLGESRERGEIVRALEELAAASEHFPVRRQAAIALERLGRARPPVGPARAGLRPFDYREVVLRTARPALVDLETSVGRLRFEIACPEAPLTCVNFLQLSNQGFYDGLSFHRLMPGFALQSGDPRGDGWGSLEYTIREEPGRLAFARGALGMTRSVPDSASSQFFIVLSPQPQLEGELTAFGRLARGEELLDLIDEGDRIFRIREVDPGTPNPLR